MLKTILIRTLIGDKWRDFPEDIEVDTNCSSKTVQTYFNEHLKEKLITSQSFSTVRIHWYDKKIYEFIARKTDDDQRHQEGRKKRAPRHIKDK